MSFLDHGFRLFSQEFEFSHHREGRVVRGHMAASVTGTYVVCLELRAGVPL